MSRQEDHVKLLAIGLLNLADDEGYFHADSRMVRNALRPLDDDSVMTHGGLIILEEIGFIERREHRTHGPIGKVVSFRRHQVVNRPSKSALAQVFNACSVNGHGGITDDSSREGKGKEQGKDINPLPPLQGETGEISGPDLALDCSDSSPSDEVEDSAKKEKGGVALARARGLFRIRPGTPLDAAEKRAWQKNWRAVVATDEVGWKALEWWFAQPVESPVAKYRRRKLSFLLNGWNSDLQAAISVAQQNGVLAGLRGVSAVPDGWRGIVGELDPEFHCPDRWEELPEPVRRAVWEEVKNRGEVAK
jgi:hypothetical protein